MRIIYITTLGNSESAGVEKKISNQILVLARDHEVMRLDIKKIDIGRLRKLISRFPGGSISRDYIGALTKVKRFAPDVVFFRGISFDKEYVSFIRSIKKELDNVHILFEVPTYPYGWELLGNKTMWPWFFKDCYYRNKMIGIIDRVITYSDDRVLFGIPTIIIKNGIIVDGVKVNGDTNKSENGEIVLLAVAKFQKAHGYERIIRGLRDYYDKCGKHRVLMYMIGEGEEEHRYKSLVTKYKLEKYVYFVGPKYGNELVEYYKKADVGLSCFGLYKLGIKSSSALKVREYLAYGLPIVTGVSEDAFPNNESEFLLCFANDSSDVKIEKIVDFCLRNRCKYGKNLRREVREYAKRTVDMEVTMKPIIDYIESVAR